MKRKLHITALITSPIIALYGLSPFFIFQQISLIYLLPIVGGTTVSVYIVWLVHFFFEHRFPNQNKIIRFLATYAVNIAIRIPFVFLHLTSQYISADKYHLFPILTSLVLNAIIMVIMDSIITGDKKAEIDRQLQELKWQNTESQKQVLMQQLQPHFLFNALSILKSLIKENTEQAEAYTTRLSDFLRYAVQSQDQQLVTVKTEMQFVSDYINLQKVRYGEAFSYTIDIPEELQKKNIPVLALEILVENIFKHNNFTEKKPLHFSITVKNGSIVVWNEKTSVRQSEKNNTGLSNLNARYMLICEKNISVSDTENEFNVTLPVINV